MLSRLLERERGAQIRAGVIAAAIYNSNPFRDSHSKPVSPLDFVARGLAKDQPEPEQTIEEQIAVLTGIFGCGPGKN